MINAIEVLFGLAAAMLLGGIAFYGFKKRDRARKLLSFGLAALFLAVAGELYVRYVR